MGQYKTKKEINDILYTNNENIAQTQDFSGLTQDKTKSELLQTIDELIIENLQLKLALKKVETLIKGVMI